MLVMLLLLAGGCVTAVSPETAAKLNIKETGLVLATTESIGSEKDVKRVVFEFYVRPTDPGRRLSVYYISSGKPMWLLEIPPGKYRIDDWFLGSGTARSVSAAEGFEFEVKPGEVTYIGHFKFSVHLAKNMLGMRVIPQGLPVLENSYEVALKQFRKDYPSLVDVAVRNSAPPQTFLWGETDESAVNFGIVPTVIK